MAKNKEIQINTLPGYEMVSDFYFVRDDGKIIGACGEMKPFWQRSRKYPYQSVRFRTKDGGRITKRVCRIVALAFVDGRTEARNQVDHINGRHSDDRPSNLRWVTKQENMDALIVRRYKEGITHKQKSMLDGQIAWREALMNL